MRAIVTFMSDAIRSATVLWIIVGFNAMPLLRRAFGRRDGPQSYPVRFRLTLERLGTSYLKLGQFMAMRFDLLPMELCDELQRLFENVPPMPAATAIAVVERELGGPLSHFFSGFNPEPIGAASIAQVHEARTLSGARVAVKIQRPGITRQFDADMRILGGLARVVDATGLVRGLDVHAMISEFSSFTRRELNFMREGQTADQLRRSTTASEVVPRIHWSMTTQRLLTMDFIDGLSIAAAASMLARGNSTAVAAKLPQFAVDTTLRHLATASLHQFFSTGFFHADPHPGNIILLADNRIAFVDFGIFGMLSDEKREWLVGYTENVAVGNIEGAYRYYAKLSTPTSRTDLAAFKRETKDVLLGWYRSSLQPAAPMRERHVAKVIGDITGIMRRHHVRLDLDTMLFWRATIALDASALSLSKDFDLIREMRIYFTRCRPSPAQRFLGAATQPKRAVDVADAIRRVPQAWQDSVADRIRGAAPVDLQRAVSASSRDTADAYSRAIIAGVLSIAATPLALQAGDDLKPIAIMLLALWMSCTTTLMAVAWRR